MARLLLSCMRRLRNACQPTFFFSSTIPSLSSSSLVMDLLKEFSTSSYSAETNTNIKLYSYWLSSCCWRVRFALNFKELYYEYKAVDLSKREQFAPEFERLNPLHFVPVLVDGDLVVSDSFAILLYLDEKYPHNALLPLDSKKKAVNLQVASIISSSMQPLHMQSVLKYLEQKVSPEDTRSWAQHYIVEGFTALEELLRGFTGKYATGDEVSMADVFLAPQISVATSRFGIDMPRFPTLSRINEAYKVLPAFQASVPEKQPDAKIL